MDRAFSPRWRRGYSNQTVGLGWHRDAPLVLRAVACDTGRSECCGAPSAMETRWAADVDLGVAAHRQLVLRVRMINRSVRLLRSHVEVGRVFARLDVDLEYGVGGTELRGDGLGILLE